MSSATAAKFLSCGAFCLFLGLTNVGFAQPWNTRAKDIIKTHDAAVNQLRKQNVAAAEILNLAEQRNERLRALTIEMEEAANDESLSRALALATCYEYLKDLKQCLIYCKKAHRISPRNATHYYPWIRTVLNQGNMEEAIQILEGAKKTLGPESPIHGFHGQLYFYYLNQKDYKSADKHAAEVCDYYFRLLQNERPGARQALANFLPKAEEVSYLAHASETMLNRFRRIKEYLDGLKTTENSKIDFWFHQLNCELTRSVATSTLETATVDWILFAQASFLDDVSNSAARRDFIATLRYVSDHAFSINDPACLKNALKTARHALMEKQLDQHLIRSVGMLENAMSLRAKHLDVVGQKLNTLDLAGIDEIQIQDISNPQMLYFWAPFGPAPFCGFQFFAEQVRLGQCGDLKLLAFAPYSGFEWSSEQSLPRKNPLLTPTQEQKMLSAFIDARSLPGRHAMMPTSAKFEKAFSVRFYPQTVLVDAQGNVKTIVVGMSKPVQQHLRQLIHQIKSPEKNSRANSAPPVSQLNRPLD